MANTRINRDSKTTKSSKTAKTDKPTKSTSSKKVQKNEEPKVIEPEVTEMNTEDIVKEQTPEDNDSDITELNTEDIVNEQTTEAINDSDNEVDNEVNDEVNDQEITADRVNEFKGFIPEIEIIETKIIKNTKDSSAPVITNTHFYHYELMYMDINNERMYLISSLLNQYSTNTNKKVSFSDFIRNKGTLERINMIARVKLGSKKNVVKAVKDLNDIPGVIQQYSFNGYDVGIKGKAYIVCEKILNICLMWLDSKFAYLVSELLTRLRNGDTANMTEDLKQLADDIDQVEESEEEPEEEKPKELVTDYIIAIQVELDYEKSSIKFIPITVAMNSKKFFSEKETYLMYISNIHVDSGTLETAIADRFKEVMDVHGGAKESRKKYYSMLLQDYCDPQYYNDHEITTEIYLHEIIPKEELMTDIKNMLEEEVKARGWENTRIITMFK